jgi:uncharacterized protein (DUF1800 family)
MTLDRWQPSAEQPWDVRRVWHLHRRAGFAATWNEIQRDLHDGPEVAIARLLDPKNDEVDEFERMSLTICDAAVSAGDINRLKAWWLYRMLISSDSLNERLTLMWHNHFATSFLKVNDVGLMRKQNDLLRLHARGPFGELLTQMAKDPALLIWLDADANRKEHPNENLAREVMELFSLGVGNYSEDDVKQAARALTGWTVKKGHFVNLDEHHDDGEKNILRRTGKWNGDDFVQMLVEHPAIALRMALRLCEQLMGEATISESLVTKLAEGLREHDLNVAWGIERLLSSQAFFADENIGSRVLSPTEFVIGAARALQLTSQPPNTLLLGQWTARLGQDLFCPPNVFGWPGGRAWLSSRAVIGRANFVVELVEGKLNGERKKIDVRAIAGDHGFTTDDDIRTFLTQLILGRTEPPAALLKCDVDSLLISILASPEAQLG